MSISAAAGWITGTVLILVIGFSAIFGLRKILAGRHRAAAGLANLHPAGRAVAQAAGIPITGGQQWAQVIRDTEQEGYLQAGNRVHELVSSESGNEVFQRFMGKLQAGPKPTPAAPAQPAPAPPPPGN